MVQFRPALIEYIRSQARPIDKFSHMPRLERLTRLVGAGHTYDDDVVFAAVWLHDLGVFVGHRPEQPDLLATWDHTSYAMKYTPAVLAKSGFPPVKIPAVVEAIRTHTPSGKPTTLEGDILRDADILEQLGATTVLRTAVKVGRDTRFPTMAEVASALRKQLAALPPMIHLKSAQELAQPRIDALRQFLESLESETVGEL